MQRRLVRIAAGGLACALLVVAGGNVLRRAVLGADSREASARVQAEVREAFASMTAELRDIGELSGAPADVRLAAAGNDQATERLFAATAAVVAAHPGLDLALTTYTPKGRPLAWAGRPTEFDRLQGRGDRLLGGEAWFLVQGDPGFRLIYVKPIEEAAARSGAGARVGTLVAERPLSMVTRGGAVTASTRDCGASDAYCFPTRLGPVAITLPFETLGASLPDEDSFVVQSPTGDPLFTATARPEDLALTHERWRSASRSFTLMVIAATLLLMVGPLLDRRNRARLATSFLLTTMAAAALVVAGRTTMSLASFADWTDARLFSSATYASFLPRRVAGTGLLSVLTDRLLISPFDFVLTALTMAALALLGLVAVERWRLSAARSRYGLASGVRWAGYLAAQLAAGTLLAAILLGHESLLRNTIAQTTLDLVHFSFQPWDASRTALQVGLIIANATAAALGVVVLRAARVPWRLNRGDWRVSIPTVMCWAAPLIVWQTLTGAHAEQQLPLIVAAGVVIACAATATRLEARYRHGSQAFRLTLLALGFIVPALGFYPALFHEAGRSKVQLVETRYASEVLNQRQTLQYQLNQSLAEIDALEDLDAFTRTSSRASDSPTTDLAFEVWRQTALALYPITSSIELYDGNDNLVSRFAFNLPEDLTSTPRSEEDQCNWLFYGEVSAFFAEERPVLHAGRNLCTDGRRQGSIVVHAMLDYENLPFISSRTPYRQLFRPADTRSGEEDSTRAAHSSLYALSGRDVEFAFYGWSFTPLYPTNQPAWQFDNEVRDLLANDPLRVPMWRKLDRAGEQYDVYLLNDRSGIYALGFPVVTPLGHLVNVAELTLLGFCTYLLLLTGNAVFSAISRTVKAPALLREIRASFYRKLFLAFVAAVILPVAALALVTRNYVVQEMRSAVEQEAVRKASDARRVVEDLVTQLRIGLDDNLMVWVSRLIDQDVNVFEGPTLVATSERNLFADRSLPTRAPADVYWALQLKNEAATVTHERVGSLEEYLVAATPLTVRQAGAMLTVPLTSGQQEIENRIATLNRHMLLGALLFILAGAGLGYSMAERISDPVNRLTRATRRISRGDLDAFIVARSSDELRRLVEDFNSMAAELKRQQQALERTHRLEAWAEMARQVAHDIKNPLTPIQLTAEHLRRVHADRGAPLSPVLEECVGTILTQVRLLRQIASEFSSFASSPIAKPSVVGVSDVLSELLRSYQVGLHDRIQFAVDVPATLPPVFADRTLITRALTNIIENALHAMPGAGTLTVTAHEADGSIRIKVSDTGAGMDPEALSRAFEPYFSTKATGTGLGLPIAKRNVELNGGSIAVTSERLRGTTVEITLPIASQTNGVRS
ncbi:MAG TPA: HAMP domain-containing sensor histidine kinase [Vicinamibacterales bacterium]|nr:HAMP domain-containing sensor histidine kinase [Vicinamibacterales bacterium]